MRGPAEWHALTRAPLRIVRQHRRGGWHRTINGAELLTSLRLGLLIGTAIYFGLRAGYDVALLLVELAR